MNYEQLTVLNRLIMDANWFDAMYNGETATSEDDWQGSTNRCNARVSMVLAVYPELRYNRQTQRFELLDK